MKLKDSRENYYTHSGKASDIVRQLGFAGIALIWIFKTEQGGRFQIPTELFLPATLVVIGLSLDLLQYVAATAAWGIFNRVMELRWQRLGKGPEDEFMAPPWINWAAIGFFWGKVVIMATAYVLLIRFLAQHVG